MATLWFPYPCYGRPCAPAMTTTVSEPSSPHGPSSPHQRVDDVLALSTGRGGKRVGGLFTQTSPASSLEVRSPPISSDIFDAVRCGDAGRVARLLEQDG